MMHAQQVESIPSRLTVDVLYNERAGQARRPYSFLFTHRVVVRSVAHGTTAAS